MEGSGILGLLQHRLVYRITVLIHLGSLLVTPVVALLQVLAYGMTEAVHLGLLLISLVVALRQVIGGIAPAAAGGRSEWTVNVTFLQFGDIRV